MSAHESRLDRAFSESEQVIALRSEGYWMYRENFMWGRTPAFRNALGQFRFILAGPFDYRGRVLTPSEMLADLRDSWRPMARDERDYFCRMAADFETMKD